MTASFAAVVAAGREEAIAAARARLTSICEFCGEQTATPLTACDDPLCQEQARELYAPFRRRQVAYCPWCGDPLAGLLTDCDKPDCARRALDAEMAHVRREDA